MAEMQHGEENLVSAEMREFLGIRPLNSRIIGTPENAVQRSLLVGMKPFIEDLGGSMTETDLRGDKDLPDGVNALFFPVPVGQDKESEGMFAFPGAFREGISGVVIGGVDNGPEPDFAQYYGWLFLANGGAQYGVLGIGDLEKGKIKKAYVYSMEGAHSLVDFEADPQAAFKEIAERITHLAGGRKASFYDYDNSMPPALYDATTTPYEIIEAGHRYGEIGLLPRIDLNSFLDVSAKRKREIKILLNVSGLTPANMSEWDPIIKRPQITGSGFDKANLARHQILALQRFNPNFNGTVVWAPENVAAKPKPSVESFDQLLMYAAGAFIGSDLLKEPDIGKLLKLAKDEDAIRVAFERNIQPFQSMTHSHFGLAEYDPRLIAAVHANPRFVAKSRYHSSCGTLPLAIYSTEELLRSYFDNSEIPVYVLLLPNHGFHAVSSLRLPQLVDVLDPTQGSVSWKAVDSK